MTRDKEKDKNKQDKFQYILNELLKDEENKYCADCDAKGPRWASWNLGIFLCIRCAGIHRNLGCHVSRVKSINLDSWNSEQLQMLREIGNSRARAIYEAHIPDAFRRPQTDSTLETFIRAKYEMKKYLAQEWIPPTSQQLKQKAGELDEAIEREIIRDKKKRHYHHSHSSSTSAIVSSNNQGTVHYTNSNSLSSADLNHQKHNKIASCRTEKEDLQDIFGSFVTATNDKSNAVSNINMAFIEEHAPPITKTKSVGNDFQPFKTNDNSGTNTTLLQDIFNVPNSMNVELNNVISTRDAILALYPKNTSLSFNTNQQQSTFIQQQSSSFDLLKTMQNQNFIQGNFNTGNYSNNSSINNGPGFNADFKPYNHGDMLSSSHHFQENYLKKVQDQLAALGMPQDSNNYSKPILVPNGGLNNNINNTNPTQTHSNNILTADSLL